MFSHPTLVGCEQSLLAFLNALSIAFILIIIFNSLSYYSMIKYYRYILVFLTILSFALHLKVCDELLLNDPNVLFPPSVTDMATYKTLASQIANGTYSELFYYQPFYYAVFLARIFKLFGINIYVLILAQSLLSALTLLLAALSAEYLWNKKTAIITALLLLFSQALLFYTPFMLIQNSFNLRLSPSQV